MVRISSLSSAKIGHQSRNTIVASRVAGFREPDIEIVTDGSRLFFRGLFRR
jgi:hypothetical protein